jgi:hypothetical protein
MMNVYIQHLIWYWFSLNFDVRKAFKALLSRKKNVKGLPFTIISFTTCWHMLVCDQRSSVKIFWVIYFSDLLIWLMYPTNLPLGLKCQNNNNKKKKSKKIILGQSNTCFFFRPRKVDIAILMLNQSIGNWSTL